MREPDEIIHEKQLTLFSEAFLNDPAKTYHKQENKEGLKMKKETQPSGQAYGMKCSELSQNSDPVMSLLKMCVEQSISPSIPCTPTWSTKVTKSTLTSFLHLRLVRPTKGKDCLLSESGKMSIDDIQKLWRTPDANCDRGAVSAEKWKERQERGLPVTLNFQVAHCGQAQLPVTEVVEE